MKKADRLAAPGISQKMLTIKTITFMNLKEFKTEFALMHDKADPWGETMSSFFELCGHLGQRGADIPAEWDYHSGCGGDITEEENYWHELFANSSTYDLMEIGNLLHLITDLLTKAGKDY